MRFNKFPKIIGFNLKMISRNKKKFKKSKKKKEYLISINKYRLLKGLKILNYEIYKIFSLIYF
jgi:hypothetical protein